MPPTLTFDAAKHEYRVNGAVLPSVTQVLRDFYDFSMVAPDVLEYARQRGVAVHKAVQLDIDNDLDEASVAPEISGYLEAWRNFRSQCGLRQADFGEVERPMYHPTYKYAGTPDMTVCLYKRWTVLDVKATADLHPAVALQLAGYRELVNANTPKGQHKIEQRCALRLMDNGTYRLQSYTDKGDWSVFLAALTVHRFKEQSK